MGDTNGRGSNSSIHPAVDENIYLDVYAQRSDTRSGNKYDASKPRVDLLDRKALVQMARVLGAGASKYGDSNWRGGLAWSRTLGALLRHVLAFQDGEDKDPETGCSHIAHAMCNCMFLLNYEETHPELDDRYKEGDR